MATCNHCGYKNAVDGKICPSCGNKVQDNSAAIFLIIVLIVILIAFVLGPAYLLYKAYKTASETKTNWWLSGAVLASIIAMAISPYFKDERGEWEWFVSVVFYTNLIVLFGAGIMFFSRLKEKEYQFINLFKSQKNEI